MTWEKGRQLKTFDDISYEYNANGIRKAKTVGGVRHEYDLEGSNIRSKSFKSVLYNFVIDFTIGALWGALSGNGLADKYYVKGLFGKGYYMYNGLKYASSSFQMNKVVFKDFASAIWYFIATGFSNLVKSVVGAVA